MTKQRRRGGHSDQCRTSSGRGPSPASLPPRRSSRGWNERLDERFLAHLRGLRPGRRGAARGVDLDRQRLRVHRGAAEWEDDDDLHYPGTYIHGVYNRETTILGGHPVINEDLVNLPNWLVLKLRIEGDDPVRLDN